MERYLCSLDFVEILFIFILFINFARGEKNKMKKPLTGENSQNDMFQ